MKLKKINAVVFFLLIASLLQSIKNAKGRSFVGLVGIVIFVVNVLCSYRHVTTLQFENYEGAAAYYYKNSSVKKVCFITQFLLVIGFI